MALLLILAVLWSPKPAADRSGAEVFATVCAQCHVDNSPTATRAPEAADLRRLSRDNIIDALTLGPMTDVGMGLSDKEIEAVAAFLATPPAKPTSPASIAK